MLDPETLAYYARREANERILAGKAAHPRVARIHGELAQCYARIIQAAAVADTASKTD